MTIATATAGSMRLNTTTTGGKQIRNHCHQVAGSTVSGRAASTNSPESIAIASNPALNHTSPGSTRPRRFSVRTCWDSSEGCNPGISAEDTQPLCVNCPCFSSSRSREVHHSLVFICSTGGSNSSKTRDQRRISRATCIRCANSLRDPRMEIPTLFRGTSCLSAQPNRVAC